MSIVAEQKTRLSYQQAQAIEFWFKGQRKSKAEALRLAGYSEAVVNQPHKVFGSHKVQRVLELRGHGKEGILNNQKPKVEIKQEVIQSPKIDFSALTKEDLITLKEKLGDISYKGNQEIQLEIANKPLPKYSSMEAVFDLIKTEYRQSDYQSNDFSIM